ncbi:hypothetical protein N323_11344, partial [Cathartes aura]
FMKALDGSLAFPVTPLRSCSSVFFSDSSVLFSAFSSDEVSEPTESFTSFASFLIAVISVSADTEQTDSIFPDSVFFATSVISFVSPGEREQVPAKLAQLNSWDASSTFACSRVSDFISFTSSGPGRHFVLLWDAVT